MEYVMSSKADPALGVISVELRRKMDSLVAQTSRWIIDTQEVTVKNALKQLGWISPDDVQILREAIAMLGGISALAEISPAFSQEAKYILSGGARKAACMEADRSGDASKIGS